MESRESIYWADPNVFHLLRLAGLYGDLNTALMQPDGIVLPVSAARKYFGSDEVVGQTIEINRKHAMTVRAVLADLPMNSSNLRPASLYPARLHFRA